MKCIIGISDSGHQLSDKLMQFIKLRNYCVCITYLVGCTRFRDFVFMFFCICISY